jgi:hypothetical protein
LVINFLLTSAARLEVLGDDDDDNQSTSQTGGDFITSEMKVSL